MMSEHPIQQLIGAILIDTIPDVRSSYEVGSNGVTRIEPCAKSGPYSSIPYIRVWAGDACLAEFCQHQIVGVYFETAPIEREPLSPRQPPEGGFPADHTGLPSCTCDDCIPF